MDALNKAQRNYDRDNGESQFKRDESEFSFDDMSEEQYAARKEKMDKIKAEIAAMFAKK